MVAVADAAHTLHEHLVTFPWFVAVGVGSHGGTHVLMVYVHGPTNKAWIHVPCVWEGWPVDVKSSGEPVTKGES